MKPKICIRFLLFLGLLLIGSALCGCAQDISTGDGSSSGAALSTGDGSAPDDDTGTLLVFIEEGDGYLVENNAQRILSGEDVSFTLSIDRDVTLMSCDYAGTYEITVENGKTQLHLENVIYPTRITLQTTSRTGQILYDPNGGTSFTGSTDVIVTNVGKTVHLRPNTSIGTDTFEREGYTLTSWNTKADGSGERIGLGSRITLQGSTTTLYAQWAPWTGEDAFTWIEEGGAAIITGYRETSFSESADLTSSAASFPSTTLVIPSTLGGLPVTSIRSGAFESCRVETVILPTGLKTLEDNAFRNASLTTLVLYDDLETFSDTAFSGCDNLTTLYINAVEAPYGYEYRKESCYADKIDLLILAQGSKKMVFYGGCSMWYNLDGSMADKAFGSEYTILNLALNGTISSAVQMQIMAAYMEEGDILFHTPELSSYQQLMISTDMDDDDSTLWCGLETNYDLFSLVDLRTVGGAFDSLCHYLSLKDKRTDYLQYYSDDYVTPYYDSYGCIPFYRSATDPSLADTVSFGAILTNTDELQTLGEYYAWYESMGIRMYVSYTCVNMDELLEEYQGSVQEAQDVFAGIILRLTGTAPVSELSEYLYTTTDFYDTNYHLLSEPAKANTEKWLAALKEQMILDGLWEDGQ